jgi:hypothetical protein
MVDYGLITSFCLMVSIMACSVVTELLDLHVQLPPRRIKKRFERLARFSGDLSEIRTGFKSRVFVEIHVVGHVIEEFLSLSITVSEYRKTMAEQNSPPWRTSVHHQAQTNPDALPSRLCTVHHTVLPVPPALAEPPHNTRGRLRHGCPRTEFECPSWHLSSLHLDSRHLEH